MQKTLYLLTLVLCSAACENSGPLPASGLAPGFHPSPQQGEKGFGVSGLLFENNLVLWDREQTGAGRTELYSQMYGTRLDAADFPVWDTFPIRHLLESGAVRDAIPALVEPLAVSLDAPEAAYLKNEDLVLGAVFGNEARAWPHNILWWHEIINDIVGGHRVVMTYCPLTGSGLLFRAPARVPTLDRLELLPVLEMSWGAWKSMFPRSRVIAATTGYDRDYTAYPYGGYREEATFPAQPLQTGALDTRFDPKHVVLGIVTGDIQKAYPFSRLRGQPAVNDVLGEKPILVLSHLPSKLAVPYSRTIDGMELTFTVEQTDPLRVRDTRTGSSWNILGHAVAGPLAGRTLEQIPAYNAFWFAWAAFWPRTEILP